MAKVPDYSLALLPQEVADLLDELRFNWNFGKYQIPIVTTAPDWIGRLGESAIYAQANTWALMVCSSDQSPTWVTVSAFQQSVPYSGIIQTPVDSSYPATGRLGEMRFFASAGSWALMVNTTDGSTNWVSVSNFETSVPFSGREHIPIVSSYPAYNGRLGEMVLYAKANTWALLACTSDDTAEWSAVSTFFQGTTDYAKKALPVSAVYPLANGKLGEQAVLTSATTWALLVCTCDNTTDFVATSNFYPGTVDSGRNNTPSVTSYPTRTGRLGETMFYSQANTWALLACTSDGTNNWTSISNFRPFNSEYGLQQTPVAVAYPVGSGRIGEIKLYSAANTWALLACTSDQSTNWAAISTFRPDSTQYGLGQTPVVAAYPVGSGRLGELKLYSSANTWALLACTSDQTTSWASIANFRQEPTQYGLQQTPVTAVYPGSGRIGEQKIYSANNTWALLTCVSDQTATWVSMSNFRPNVAESGKQQLPVVAAYPTGSGRLGEQVFYSAANTWALLTCTSDQTNEWTSVSNFRQAPTQYGLQQMPIAAVYPGSGRVGEMKIYSANNTWSLLTCVSDQTDSWVSVQNFFPRVADGGKHVIPVVAAIPSGIGNLGELQVYTAANTWALFMCTSDRTTRWVSVSNFFS